MSRNFGVRCIALLGVLGAVACGSSGDGKDSHVFGSGKGGASGDADGSSSGSGKGAGGEFVLSDASIPGLKDGQAATDGSCGHSVIDSTVQRVNVLLVIDQSGSMDEKLGAGNRWDAMEGALSTAVDETSDAIDYGLDLFPSEGCDVAAGNEPVVPVELGATAAPKVKAALAATGPVTNGGTPTAAALGRALAYFKSPAGAALEGDRYVLLASDGGPNCNAGHAACAADACTVNMEGSCSFPGAPENCCDGDPANCLDDEATTRRVTALSDLGVHTFVVGIPGSEAFSTVLDAAAVAGGEPRSGSPKYYAVTDGAELTEAIRSITRTLIKSCDLTLQSEPPELDELNVEVDGARVPQTGPDGWEIIPTKPPTVRLKGATCARIEANGAEHVSIVYGCPTVF